MPGRQVVHPMRDPLDSRQLRAFVKLAQTGSFTLAAKELFLSQSAVSHSMRALEEDVGCLLFDRVGKRVSLTLAGESLLHHADRVLKEMETARAALEQMGRWGKQRLRVGASTTACQYILPGVLGELRQRFPDCVIAIEPGDTMAVTESVREGRIDLALAMEPREESQFEFIPLFTDELQFLLSPHHSAAVSGRMDRESLPREKCILYSRNSHTYRMVEEYFREEGVVLNLLIELGSMEAIKELVKLNLGVGIMAPWVAKRELESGELKSIPLGRRKLKRRWGIVVRRGKRMNLPEETFTSLCRSVGIRCVGGAAGEALEAGLD